MQFRKNDNSVGNLGGGIAEDNVKVTGFENSTPLAPIGMQRGSSQQNFPSQNMNFGQIEHAFGTDT